MNPLLVAGCIASLIPGRLGAVEIVAHRGASYDAPENTLAALRLAWVQKADAAEVDAYLTKDGRIVVIHDADTRRTTGVKAKVAAMTLEEICALDAGSWKGTAWSGERIPTLEEAIAAVPEGKRLLVEIKCGPEILPELERVIAASSRKRETFAIIGFSYETMTAVKSRLPQVEAYWIVSPTKATGGFIPSVDDLIGQALRGHLDGLDLDSRFALDSMFVTRVKEAGLDLLVWTVDDPVVAKKLVALGVDGITTNRPAWLRERLRADSIAR